MGQFVAKVLMYGDLANPEYAETFNGIFSRYKEFSTVRGEPGAQMINAAAKSASGNKYCSAVFVDWGPRKVNGIYPKNTAAGVNMQDLGEGDAYDANGNAFRAVQTLFNWKVGLAVENYRSIAMVRNIETATLPTLDSDARRLLLDKLIYAKNRLMNPRPLSSTSLTRFTVRLKPCSLIRTLSTSPVTTDRQNARLSGYPALLSRSLIAWPRMKRD